MSGTGKPRREDKRLDGGGTRAMLLALCAVVLFGAVLPYGSLGPSLTLLALVGGLALGVTAVVLASRALARTRGSETQAPGAVLAIVAGSLGAAFGLVLLVGIAVLGTEMAELADCQSRAITASAETACTTQFEEAVRERAGLD